MRLPKSIEPCPIIDATFEVRFETSIHSSAVFGVIYNSLRNEFPQVESLPILQLPEPLRLSDPNLKFAPHNKILNNNFVIQIGPSVLSISSYPKYLGWDTFSKKIYQILETIEKLQIIRSVSRIGIRYVNFFDGNIFESINLGVNISGKNIDYNNTIIKTEINQGNFKSTLQIANNVTLPNKMGSVIDIDTFKDYELGSFFKDKVRLINEGHINEKEVFFNLLNEELLQKHNPKY